MQTSLPKKIIKDFKIKKGTKLIINEDAEKITIKPIHQDLFSLISQPSLRKMWDNEYDDRWDDVF